MITDYDMLSSLDIDALIVMKKNKEFLDKHPYAIWQSKDGKYWYTTLPDKTKERGVRQIRRNSKKELEEAIIEYWKENTNKKTVSDVFKEWNLNRLETKRIVEATYININNVFKWFMDSMKNRYIDDIKPFEWCDFLEKTATNGKMHKVVFNELKSVVVGIIKMSYKRGYIEYTSSAVTDLLDIPENAFVDKDKPDKEEVYSEEETPRIIEWLIAHKNKVHLAILLMFVTGLRFGELVVLKHGSFVGNVVQVRCTLSGKLGPDGRKIKGVKDTPKSRAGIRDIIVPKDYKWLTDYFAEGNPDEYIFFDYKNNCFMCIDTVNRHLRKMCAELEIPYRSSHKIRKTYGTVLLDNNVDNRLVIQQMGHSHISITEGYYHKDRKDDARKAEIIDRIGQFYQT